MQKRPHSDKQICDSPLGGPRFTNYSILSDRRARIANLLAECGVFALAIGGRLAKNFGLPGDILEMRVPKSISTPFRHCTSRSRCSVKSFAQRPKRQHVRWTNASDPPAKATQNENDLANSLRAPVQHTKRTLTRLRSHCPEVK